MMTGEKGAPDDDDDEDDDGAIFLLTPARRQSEHLDGLYLLPAAKRQTP